MFWNKFNDKTNFFKGRQVITPAASERCGRRSRPAPAGGVLPAGARFRGGGAVLWARRVLGGRFLRRRFVSLLEEVLSAREGRETLPYTIYAWFLREKSCLTCFVARCDGVLRRRLVSPFLFFGAARIYPCTIYAWFLRKKSCLTCFVVLYPRGFYGQMPVQRQL